MLPTFIEQLNDDFGDLPDLEELSPETSVWTDEAIERMRSESFDDEGA